MQDGSAATVPARLQHLVNLLTLDRDTAIEAQLTDPERMRRTLNTVMRHTGLHLARNVSYWGGTSEWAEVARIR
jgi:hypothetical protein